MFCWFNNDTNKFIVEEHNIASQELLQQLLESQLRSQDRGRNRETLTDILDSFINRSHNHNRNDSNNNGNSSDSAAYDSNYASITSVEALAAALDQLRAMDNSSFADSLLSILDNQSSKTKGVQPDFLDTLERVSVKDIEDVGASCPICTNRFKDDKYPLIVKLPCTGSVKHVFDLECIGPWLMTNSTCPMCRTDVLAVAENRRKRIEEEIRKAKEDDSEEEPEDGWDVYG